MTVQWGDVATWIGSFGTVTTLGFALIQIINERKLEAKCEKVQTEKRFQGERVSAWLNLTNIDLSRR
ncbi:hypothetical protein SOP93_17075 [Peribacillus frigoritolerans]|uniref:hypothetical protein n=1 Tax=Peribacillus frigoritolerans TaxID=450367 RepID=UPI002B24804A|nr:hypothetical protein [Peribacillus frigoritolerans]MEB2492879.1 hypothetical protein [Peribacillus frigoritolerans]